MTFKEICFTQKGPCVGKAQLQHHMAGGRMSELFYFWGRGNGSHCRLHLCLWYPCELLKFPVTCIVVLAFLCVRCKRLFKSSPLAAAVQSLPHMFLLPRNISTHQYRINSLYSQLQGMKAERFKSHKDCTG